MLNVKLNVNKTKCKRLNLLCVGDTSQKACVMKQAFSLQADIKCPDVLNKIDQTSGDLNVTIYQCYQSSP